MDDAKVDRLARVFTKTVSRRWLVLLVGAAVGTLRQQKIRGFQLGPPTCRKQGAVCTLLFGCCDGLTCATSAINTSYGICVPGEGGMVSTGTSLISPFSDTAVEEISARCKRHQPRPRPISRPNGKRISLRSGPARTPKVQSGRHDRTPSGAPSRPVRMSGGRGNRKFLKRK